MCRCKVQGAHVRSDVPPPHRPRFSTRRNLQRCEIKRLILHVSVRLARKPVQSTRHARHKVNMQKTGGRKNSNLTLIRPLRWASRVTSCRSHCCNTKLASDINSQFVVCIGVLNMKRTYQLKLSANHPKNKAAKGNYLEVVLREGLSEADINSIIQALSTISSFFGAQLEKGGGGGGGQQLRQKKLFTPLPLSPSVGSETHIGRLL